MNLAHLLSRLRIRTRRKARVSRFLTSETGWTARTVELLLYVWLPFLRPVTKPRVVFDRFGSRAEFRPCTYYDLEVWRDVFEDGDCEIDLQPAPRVILDLGAHVGFASMYYAMKYPDAEILAVEAEPSNYRQLVENVSQFRNVRSIHCAVCGADRPVELHVHPRSVSHSLVDRAVGGSSTVVPGRSLDSLLAEFGIDRVDLIKFNIEGMEFEVLNGFSWRHEVGAWLGYFHFDLSDEYGEDFLDMFQGYSVERKSSKPHRLKIYAVRKTETAAQRPGPDADASKK